MCSIVNLLALPKFTNSSNKVGTNEYEIKNVVSRSITFHSQIILFDFSLPIRISPERSLPRLISSFFDELVQIKAPTKVKIKFVGGKKIYTRMKRKFTFSRSSLLQISHNLLVLETQTYPYNSFTLSVYNR